MRVTVGLPKGGMVEEDAVHGHGDAFPDRCFDIWTATGDWTT